MMIAAFLFACLPLLATSFKSTFRSIPTMRFMKMDGSGEVYYDSIALTGFVSKELNFADTDPFSKIYEKSKVKLITAVSDDIAFARKRLVTPKSVYTGLIDVLEYSETDLENIAGYETVLMNKDAWMAFNMTSSQVLDAAKVAAKAGLKRVVLAVNLTVDESTTENLVFQEAQDIFKAADIQYTIVKYSQTRQMAEAKYPYRVTRDVLPLPCETPLSDGDLMRVLSEIFDLPKTFGSVYGLGGGSRLDAEILIYMKSQGWPERVQVGMLMGTLMETIEKKFEEEKKRQASLVVAPKIKTGPESSMSLL